MKKSTTNFNLNRRETFDHTNFNENQDNYFESFELYEKEKWDLMPKIDNRDPN